MLADDRPVLIDDLPRRIAQLAAEEPGGVAVRDEADVVAVRLVRDGQPSSGCFGANIGLDRRPERKHRMSQLGSCQHAEDVGLVLDCIGGAVQLATTGPVDEPRVMPGAHGVESERHRSVQDRRELDLLVAPQAWIGRAPGGVLGHEVGHDVGTKALGRSQT